MPLISLVYVSVESHPLSEADLVEILKKAREKNSRLGITGMLLYRDGFFIQCLEGEKSAVEELYAVIKLDKRHKNVLTVSQTKIAERTFQDWTMGFSRISNTDLNNLDGYQDYLDKPFDNAFFSEKPSRALVLLEHFRNRTFF